MSRHRIWTAVLPLLGGILVAGCADRPLGAVGPANPAPPPAAKKSVYVMVGSGQTLDRLAQTYHAAKRDIIAANNLHPPYTLKPNTLLEIPIPEGELAQGAADRTSANKAQAKTAARPQRAKAKRSEPEVIPLD